MKRVVIDLEMCKVSKRVKRQTSFKYQTEIIQIGAVMLSDDFSEISSLNIFVKPEFGYIDWFIEDLTGITETKLSKAPSLSEALSKMIGWLGDEEVKFYSWSNADYIQIAKECALKGIDIPGIERILDVNNWQDYQETFKNRFKMGRVLCLKTALDLADVDLTGREHDGLADARNTGKLIEKLENDPDYEIPYFDEDEDEKGLKFSLGSLLEGINLGQESA